MNANQDPSVSTIRIPTFDGRREHYQKWKMQFKAYCVVKGFHGALRRRAANMPANAIDTLTPDGDEDVIKIKYIRDNEKAYAAYTLALEGDQVFQLITTAINDDWPDGAAHLITERLDTQCQPDDQVAKIEIESELAKVTMAKEESPVELFNQLANVRVSFTQPGRPIPDDKFYPTVIRVSPEAYDTNIQTAMKDTFVTLNTIQDSMMEKYRFMCAKNTAFGQGLKLSSKSPTETGLAGVGGIVCYKCKTPGHKANDPKCPMKGKPYNYGSGGGNGGGRRGGGKFQGNCNHCGMKYHKAVDCFEKPENASKRPPNWKSKMNAEQETNAAALSGSGTPSELNAVAVTTFATNMELLKDPDVFIGDTGATCDSTASAFGMYACREAVPDVDSIAMADSNCVETEKVGALSGIMVDKNGKELSHLKLSEVSFAPAAAYNLFSVSKRVNEGWTLSSELTTDGDTSLVLVRGGARIVFDIKIETPKGAIYCMRMKRKAVRNEAGATSLNIESRIMPPVKPKVTININHAHQLYGHYDEPTTRQAVYARGIGIVRGTLKPCNHCAMAKSKQRHVPAIESEADRAVKPNGRVALDISTIKAPKALKLTLGKPNWRIMVDELTGMKFSDFFATKNGMVEPTCEKLNLWKDAKIPVTYLRMDNAGENKALHTRMNSVDWKLNIKPEYTARDTPQQNSLAESAFRTLWNNGRALMYCANLPEKQRYLLATFALTTATMLNWLQIITLNGVSKTRYEHWHPKGKVPKFASHLRLWGEAGVVKTKAVGTAKVNPRGVECMMVGYALNHAEGVYKMWNPITNRIIVSRDIIWMRRMYYKPDDLDGKVRGDMDDGLVTFAPENDDDDDNNDADEVKVADTVEDANMDVPDRAPAVTTTTRSGRVVSQPQRLVQTEWAGSAIASMNLSKPESTYYAAMMMASKAEYADGEVAAIGIDINEVACVGMGTGSAFKNTSELKVLKLEQALSGPDKEHWERAVEEEYQRMNKSGVFKVVKQSDVPAGATITSSTWACKKKANGTYRARLNCRGFQQIEGEHYDSSNLAAPVTNEMSVRLFMVLAIMAGWRTYVLDVRGAFLLGSFEDGEMIYMSRPRGFEQWYPPDIALLLLKTIYGTKQAAMAFWREMNRAMKDMDFARSTVDPCVFYQWTGAGLCVWLLWVDDCLCLGPEDAVKIATDAMKARFDCDDIGEMLEYVGCKIDRDYVKRTVKFTQPVMVQSFSDEFDIKDAMKRPPVTPAEPGSVLLPALPENYVTSAKQAYYRSGVGKMLHMMRWSRPETYSSTRELSRSLKGASQLHIKAMHRQMAYVVSTPDRGFVLDPSRLWNGRSDALKFIIAGEADSDYAKCPVTRRSISGNVTRFEGVAIIIKSIMQKLVALSVTESELYSGVTTAQDMLYLMRLVESVGLEVELPMILSIDNKGAVDLANNWSCGGRTRHVKLNFLRELKEAGIIKTVWFSGWDNPADMFTKNLPGPDFRRHRDTLFGKD